MTVGRIPNVPANGSAAVARERSVQLAFCGTVQGDDSSVSRWSRSCQSLVGSKTNVNAAG